MEKMLLAVLSAMLGFLLSQSFNFVNFLRRPRFRTKNWSDGVLSLYTGDPPETPWEIDLGFYLENNGKNPAKNTRVFLSDLRVATSPKGQFDQTSTDFLELKRPIDLIPHKECVAIRLGRMTSDSDGILLDLHALTDENKLEIIALDTRDAVRLSTRFHITCDDRNSFQRLLLEFCPAEHKWGAQLLEDKRNMWVDRPL